MFPVRLRARLGRAFLLALTLCGCAAPVAPAPTPSSSSAPSPAPTATVAPTAAPTLAPSPTTEMSAAPTPAPAGRLPRPIYFIGAESGQVMRLEADGASVRQISFEDLPVRWLAVAPATGTIVYVTADEVGRGALIALDGAGRRQLMAGTIAQPALSPDGSSVVYRLEDPEPGLIIGQEESPAGVWSSFTSGMRPSLLRADLPADGVYDPDNPAWSFWPVAFAPDGARLAIAAFDADGPGIPGSMLQILDLGQPGGQADSVELFTCCEEERWSFDGAALTVAGGGPGPDLRYGLFRIDAASGAEQVYLEADEQTAPLVTAPQQLADGQVYAFVEIAPWDELTWERPFRPALSRVDADGTVTPLRPVDIAPFEVLWDAQAAGALVTTFADPAAGFDEGQLAWVPVGDGEPLLLPARGSRPHWAPDPPLSAGDCAAFAPIVYEPVATREPRAEVRDIQRRLAALGYDAGAADGLYGEQTRAAVEAFRAERGLPAGADIDCATWQALLAP